MDFTYSSGISEQFYIFFCIYLSLSDEDVVKVPESIKYTKDGKCIHECMLRVKENFKLYNEQKTASTGTLFCFKVRDDGLIDISSFKYLNFHSKQSATNNLKDVRTKLGNNVHLTWKLHSERLPFKFHGLNAHKKWNWSRITTTDSLGIFILFSLFASNNLQTTIH